MPVRRTKAPGTKAPKAAAKKSATGKQVGSRVTQRRAATAALHVVDFEKTAFDNAAKVVKSVQEQTEKLLLDMLQRPGWMPEEAKDIASEWVKLLRRSRTDFTRTMDKSFGLVSGYLKRLKEEELKEAKGDGKARVRRKPRAAKRPAKSVITTPPTM